jgi:hypothetical protein
MIQTQANGEEGTSNNEASLLGLAKGGSRNVALRRKTQIAKVQVGKNLQAVDDEIHL